MTLNIDKEYLGELGFDYEKIAKEVVEAALDFENALMKRKSVLYLRRMKKYEKQMLSFVKLTV